MSLTPGTRLGVYEIIAQIGEGGMGAVYRGTDTTLSRQVAIKILPDAFASDPERLARFEREAKTLASLNHPNIAAVYGFEKSDGTHALVMELVEGDDLSQRIARGAIPVDDALPIAKQIAEALEAAHEQGIIHRDLKPANIKVRPDGTVKVLDFGLAKAMEPVGAMLPSVSQAPTITTPAMMTGVGMILGTAAYMSPEQARGKTVDKRADIWAFGCVLYEMLTGHQAFCGEDVAEVLASVVKSEPGWNALPADTPDGIRMLLRRCLNKEAKRRFRDAADVVIQIEETTTAPAVASGIAVIHSQPAWRWAVSWALALLVGGATTGIAVWKFRTPTPPSVVRFALTLPPTQQLAGAGNNTVALSPDGKSLVYASNRQLYLRSMDSLDANPIPGTEGADGPFFSPDGQWIGFFAEGKLQKVSINGGPPLFLSDTTGSFASWGPNDKIIFAPGPSANLLQVSASGGTPQPLTTRDFANGEVAHVSPQILPDGKAFVFTAWRSNGDQIVVQDFETGERRVLIQNGTSAHYVATGHLVYVREGTLLAVPFDLARLEVTGAPVPLIEGIMQGRGSRHAAFGISGSGSLVYVLGDGMAEGTLVWVHRTGEAEPLLTPPRRFISARLSPDGQRIALGIEFDIWVYDIVRDALTRLTFEGTNLAPLWTPDGRRITYRYAGSASAEAEIRWKLADGSGGEETLVSDERIYETDSWSADGTVLTFTNVGSETGPDIWTLTMDENREPRPFLQTPFAETSPMISPDAHWMTYVSNESGQPEVYVQPFPGPGGKWQISTDGGVNPMWARNGRELFYESGDRLMVADITTQPAFAAGSPNVLFAGNGQYFQGATSARYDISADGQRFLMIREGGGSDQTTAPPQIIVIQNWQEELKRLVPTN